MIRTRLGIGALAALLLLPSGGAWAVTRDVADLSGAPLTLRQSVISQLSDGVLKDPYDEFLRRSYNLSYVNIERYANLSPWPGQQGEQDRYVDFVIGNNGNSNVQNGADTVQGTYIAQSHDRFSWGLSAAYLSDNLQNSDFTAGSNFNDGQQLSGFDARFGMGYRISDNTVLGGGIGAVSTSDEVEDSSFTQGVGGFFSLQEVSNSGVEADFGFRLFTGDVASWDGRLVAGFGDTEVNDFSETLDDTGAVTSRFVITDYDVANTYLELAGGYNRRFGEDQGEMQVQFGLRQTNRELDNTLLSYTDVAGTVTPSLELLAQDPVTTNEIFVSADTLFVRGWTQIFGGARLSLAKADGSTQVDSVGTIVDEAIDDSSNRLSLVMGLRQPLWNERFRLVARARADLVDRSLETDFGISSTGTEFTQTTTAFAIGIETVLNNMVFDVAWLFGGEPAPGGAGDPTRQTIDLDRLVVSATFGW